MSIRIRLSLLLIAFLATCMPVAQAQPAKPTLLTATQSDDSAQVTYSRVTGVPSYNVYWSTSPSVTKANALGSKNFTGSAGAIDSLDPKQTYYFVVTAVNSAGESDVSNEMKATPASPVEAKQAAAAASTPVQPTTNVGQSTDTNVQNPTMKFVAFTPADYPVLGSTDQLPNGTITFDPTGLETLVKASCANSESALKDGSTYTVINVLRLAGTPDAQSVASNNWYVYSNHKSFSTGFAGGWKLTDFDGATRLYGARKILLLSILEYDRTAYGPGYGPAIDYSLTVTKQQATNLSDVVQLLGLVFPKPAAAGAEGSQPNYRACSAVPVAYKTSTIKVSLSYTAANNIPYTASQSFVNEAKEHWDVSFALPIKKASALQYDSTANTVTASQINKTALYAVFDWYPYPVDLKNSKFNYIPGIFAGVAMNSQPLHSLICGASVGTKFAQFYAGALLLKQQDLTGLSTGGTGNPTQVANATSYVFKPQFSVGIKISISAAASALKSSK